jgi:hypothetical protein
MGKEPSRRRPCSPPERRRRTPAAAEEARGKGPMGKATAPPESPQRKATQCPISCKSANHGRRPSGFRTHTHHVSLVCSRLISNRRDWASTQKALSNESSVLHVLHSNSNVCRPLLTFPMGCRCPVSSIPDLDHSIGFTQEHTRMPTLLARGRISTIDTLFSGDERRGDKLACILAISYSLDLATLKRGVHGVFNN